jgi:hypothetical protein
MKKVQGKEIHSWNLKTILRIESSYVLHIPRVWHSLSVIPLEALSGWADNFGDDEGSFPRGREFVHAVGLLDAPEDEVTNIEGSFLNVAVV